jgi:predicted lactoylglutathione lyase
MNLWLNIYAKDVEKLTRFYQEIGFVINRKFKQTNQEASFVFNQTVLMIFKDGFFDQAFPAAMRVPENNPATVLFSIDMPSIEAAEALVKKAVLLGGKDLTVNPSLKMKGFYNTGFIDPEGHLWNILVTL